MTQNRKVEIFAAGCPACESTISLINSVACPSCEVTVLDMNESAVAARANNLGIRSVPAVVVDGKLAICCQDAGVTQQALEVSGVGKPAVHRAQREKD